MKPKSVKMFGEAPSPQDIRDQREFAGLTQTHAAQLVHSSLRAWQAWEAGERKMHPAIWELFWGKTITI